MPRKRALPTDPVEVVARALCRLSDPDEEYRGAPLWKANEREAKRIVEALAAAGLLKGET
jgi:hypothetical protein